VGPVRPVVNDVVAQFYPLFGGDTLTAEQLESAAFHVLCGESE